MFVAPWSAQLERRRVILRRTFLVAAALTAWGFVVGPAAPALAADPVTGTPVPAIDHLDFSTPRTPWDYKTNVPASVLKEAAKSSTRGPAGGYSQATAVSQLATSSRSTKGAQQLSSTKGPNVKDWLASKSNTPAQQKVITETTKSARFPATGVKGLAKGAVAGTAPIIAAQGGFAVGKTVSGFWGFDVDGGLCQPGFNDLGLIASVTGTDCTDFFAFQDSYEPNTDASGGSPAGTDACATDSNGVEHCVRMLGSIIKDESPIVCMSDEVGQPGMALEWYSSSSSDPTGRNAGSYLPYSNYYVGPCQASGLGATVRGGYITFNTAKGIERVLPDSYMWTDGQGVKRGTEGKVSTPTADPERYLECTVRGTDGNEYVSYSEPFRESDGVLAQPVCPEMPDGVIPSQIEVDTKQGKGADAPGASLGTWETTDAFQDWATRFPECLTGLCTAELFKVTGTELDNCFDNPAPCVNWFTEPNKQQLYQCQYAGQVVDLSECNHYASTFDPEKLAAGQGYADPETGKPGAPGSSPSTSTGTGVRPGVGSAADLGIKEAENCFPTGWGVVNPVNWVFMPVRCAIVWAFVPRGEALELTVAKVPLAWADTPPAKVIGFVGDFADDLPEVAGCQGLRLKIDVDFPWKDTTFVASGIHIDQYILGACEGGMANVATIARLFGAVVMYYGALQAITRYFGVTIGFTGFGKSQ